MLPAGSIAGDSLVMSMIIPFGIVNYREDIELQHMHFDTLYLTLFITKRT